MTDNKRRHHRTAQPELPHPCRPARRIARETQVREDYRLGVPWS